MLALFPEFGCWVRQNRRLAGGCKGGKMRPSDRVVALIENPYQLPLKGVSVIAIASINEALMDKLAIAFLASNNGTSFRTVNEAIRANTVNAAAVVLVSNRASSAALAYAEANGIPSFHSDQGQGS
ncbi:hypothetical protein [Rhizobium sp. BK491]|uniref:hypothetical protein n=1 Tax=Rhizobium sp. BK491 TaxID=2587009 RepID=UPI001829C799|nr:hypothetical protein [Rhizobium sp. BK491]MBB3568489.1 hypothetical protein [Rhizobium sp. BK491]